MRRIVIAFMTALALPLAMAAPANAGGLDDAFAKLLVQQVKGTNVHKHLQALQDIATANGGNRAAGTS
ncbi:aminopeptidase, partial [Nonomuraea sp. 3N208]